jgi:hypothetical protein
MRNVKQEFLQAVANKAQVVCAIIYHLEYIDNDGNYVGKYYNLKQNHTPEEYNDFLQSLDFNDTGYALAELIISGVIWLSDGSWIDRKYNDYTGDEYWEHVTAPTIPDHLINI